jgi:hypothetical protein
MTTDEDLAFLIKTGQVKDEKKTGKATPAPTEKESE